MSNNYKTVIDGKTYLKVIGFPGRESMWVKVLDGTDNWGVGELDNNAYFTTLEVGDKIVYGWGDDETKPRFISAFEEFKTIELFYELNGEVATRAFAPPFSGVGFADELEADFVEAGKPVGDA